MMTASAHTHPAEGVPYFRAVLGPDDLYSWAECPECHAIVMDRDGYGPARHWQGDHCPACPEQPAVFDLRSVAPPRLRSRMLPTDVPVQPRDGGWDTRCGWDEATHPDEVRPVCVAIQDDTYSGDLGRMCAVHYRAVLSGRR